MREIVLSRSFGDPTGLSGLIEEPASVTTTIIIRSGEIRLRIDIEEALSRAAWPFRSRLLAGPRFRPFDRERFSSCPTRSLDYLD